MNRVFAALKLNFYAVKASLHIAVLMFALSFLIGLLTKLPVVTIVYNMMFSTFLSSMIFSVEDKSAIHKLYGILPLKRSEWAGARYLYAAILGLISLALAGAAFALITKIVGVPFESATFFTFLGASFLYYCFSVGIIYPIYMHFSFAKAYIFTMLPIALIGVGVMILARKTDLSGSIAGFMGLFSTNRSLLLLGAFCAGFVFLAVSALIARAIYSKKEL